MRKFHRKPSVPEPWMFGVEATIDGDPIGNPSIGRFTLLGRARMALRVLRGQPAWRMLPDGE